MELRHLRYFVALAECLHFTRAAERVHVTQSTLSHQIRQLEDEVGKRLFERVDKRVLITEEGELFLGYAVKALKEVDLGIGALKGAGSGLSGSLRIGATHTFNVRFIPECVAALLQRHPTINVTVNEQTVDEIGAHLIAGGIDMGISYHARIPQTLQFEPLYNDQMVLAVSPAHPLAHRKRVRLVELHRQPLVLLPKSFATRAMLDECFHACGATPVIVAELDTISPTLGLVERLPVGAIVSKYALQRHSPLRAIPLESPTPLRTSGIVWRRDQFRTEPMRTFAAIVRRMAGAVKQLPQAASRLPPLSPSAGEKPPRRSGKASSADAPGP
jgi:LysR family cyn operon transcriptional activator